MSIIYLWRGTRVRGTKYILCPWLSTVFSAVEHLALQYRRLFISRGWIDEAHRTHWRELLRTFSNVKTISIDKQLIEQLSRSLQPAKGESSAELLPELQELS